MITIATILSIGAALTKAVALVGMAVEGLKIIGRAVMGIAKALFPNAFKPETTVEDLGDKAIQSGFKPEDFKSYEEYVKAVEDFKTDPEKSKTISEEMKTAKGIELTTGLLAEKAPTLPVGDLVDYLTKNPILMKDNNKLIAGIFSLANKDQGTFSEIVKYMNGTEKDFDKRLSAINTIANILKEISPEMSANDAKNVAMNLRK